MKLDGPYFDTIDPGTQVLRCHFKKFNASIWSRKVEIFFRVNGSILEEKQR